MTAMNTPSTKSLSHSLVLARVTGDPCLNPWPCTFGDVSFDCQPPGITLPSGRVMIFATALSPHQTSSVSAVKQIAIQSP
jgi:hypothetical protein